MRAETLIQEQQSSLHNSRLKGIQTGLFFEKKKKKEKKRTKYFLQPSVNMSVGRIWQTENKRFGKKKNNNPRRLERDTFCALSERRPCWSPFSELTDYKKRLQVKALRLRRAIQITQWDSVNYWFHLLQVSDRFSPVHGSNLFLNKNRNPCLGRQPIHNRPKSYQWMRKKNIHP